MKNHKHSAKRSGARMDGGELQTINNPHRTARKLKKMDAKLKKIQITPVKFDKDGDIKDSEFATLTLEVPMNSTGQRAAIIELCELLDQEWVTLEIGGPA